MRLLLIAVLTLPYWVGFTQIPYHGDIYPDGWIVKAKNQTYGTGAYSILDYYTVLPNMVTADRPLLVIVPGSGFQLTAGHPKDAMEDMARKFARKGYAVAVLDYKRYPDPCALLPVWKPYVWYEGAQDVYAALKFIAAKATTYKIDMNNVFVYAQSAGGIAALPVVYNSENRLDTIIGDSAPLVSQYLGSINAHTSYNNWSYSIKAIALQSSGVMTDLSFLTGGDINETIPMLIFHSLGDNVVPFYESNDNCFGTAWGGGTMFDSSRASCKELYWDNSSTHGMRDDYADLIDNLCTSFFYAAKNNVCMNSSKVTQIVNGTVRKGDAYSSALEGVNWSLLESEFSFGSDVLKIGGTVQVLDAMGKVFYLNDLSNNVLDLSYLPSGLYIVRIELENGEFISKKIMK